MRSNYLFYNFGDKSAGNDLLGMLDSVMSSIQEEALYEILNELSKNDLIAVLKERLKAELINDIVHHLAVQSRERERYKQLLSFSNFENLLFYNNSGNKSDNNQINQNNQENIKELNIDDFIFNHFEEETLNEQPFYRDGMSRVEIIAEVNYLNSHIQEFIDGRYKPLWKQNDDNK